MKLDESLMSPLRHSELPFDASQERKANEALELQFCPSVDAVSHRLDSNEAVALR